MHTGSWIQEAQALQSTIFPFTLLHRLVCNTVHCSSETNEELKGQLLGILYFSLQTGRNKTQIWQKALLWLAERFPASNTPFHRKNHSSTFICCLQTQRVKFSFDSHERQLMPGTGWGLKGNSKKLYNILHTTLLHTNLSIQGIPSDFLNTAASFKEAQRRKLQRDRIYVTKKKALNMEAFIYFSSRKNGFNFTWLKADCLQRFFSIGKARSKKG